MSFLRVLALALAAALALTTSVAAIIDGPSEVFGLLIAAAALLATVAVVGTTPDWQAVEDDVRALRRAVESRGHLSSAPEERACSPRWPLIVLGIATALILLQRRR